MMEAKLSADAFKSELLAQKRYLEHAEHFADKSEELTESCEAIVSRCQVGGMRRWAQER